MRKKHGTASDGPSEEAAFELGVLYTTVKNDIVAFTAKEGVAYSFADAATRVANLLQAEALRQQLRNPELLREMRQNGAGHHRGRPPKSGHDELDTTSEIFAGSSAGRPLKRVMSAAGRRAISEAQRARWRRAKQAQRDREGSKRVLSPKQLRAMRKNAKLARAARKPHPTMSAETRAKISEARRRYWAAKRGAA